MMDVLYTSAGRGYHCIALYSWKIAASPRGEGERNYSTNERIRWCIPQHLNMPHESTYPQSKYLRRGELGEGVSGVFHVQLFS